MTSAATIGSKAALGKAIRKSLGLCGPDREPRERAPDPEATPGRREKRPSQGASGLKDDSDAPW